MTDPDKEFDAWIDQRFGKDPAAAIMQKEKVTTRPAFSLDAPPVVKEGPASTGAGGGSTGPAAESADESPFIDPDKKIVKVTEENELDWSDASRNIVEFFDIIQSALFGFVAKADAEERKLFKFDEQTMKDLTRLTKPVAQKRNIKVEPEWLLAVMVLERMVNNGERAWTMRKEKNAAAARQAAILAEATTAPALQIVRDEKETAKQ